MRYGEGDLVHVTLPERETVHGVVITDEHQGSAHVAIVEPDGSVTFLGRLGTAFLAPRPPGPPPGPPPTSPPPGGPV